MGYEPPNLDLFLYPTTYRDAETRLIPSPPDEVRITEDDDENVVELPNFYIFKYSNRCS
jgi:hypothetical protein